MKVLFISAAFPPMRRAPGGRAGVRQAGLVLRDVTERPEVVEAGTARIVGTDRNTIVTAAASLMDDPAAYEGMARVACPYGDGTASKKITDYFLDDVSHD